jgi:hypothetical protein
MSINAGWIKLHRRSMDSAVWSDPDLWRTWTCCLMLANHKPAWVKVSGLAVPVRVEAGQFITGRFEFHAAMYPKKKKSNPCDRTTWRWLQTLQDMQNVVIKTSNKFSTITVINWATYQNESGVNVQQNVQHVSSTCPADVQHVSTNNNEENEEKENTLVQSADAEDVSETEKQKKAKSKVTVYPDDFEQFWKAIPVAMRRCGKKAGVAAWKKAKNEGMPLISSVLASVASQAQKWTEPRYTPMASTWLNQGRWDIGGGEGVQEDRRAKRRKLWDDIPEEWRGQAAKDFSEVMTEAERAKYLPHVEAV